MLSDWDAHNIGPMMDLLDSGAWRGRGEIGSWRIIGMFGPPRHATVSSHASRARFID